MSEMLGRWGVPKCEGAIPRPSVISCLSGAAEETAILVAPSGYGKTVAAAQYAHVQPRNALWIPLNGESTDVSGVLTAIALALSAARSSDVNTDSCVADFPSVRAAMACLPGSGICLFLDDISCPAPSSVLEVVQELMANLRPLVKRIIVTTRVLGVSDGAVGGVMVVDKRLLALRSDEAVSLALAAGHDGSTADLVSSLRKTCRGHVALMRMMLALSAPSSGDLGEPGLAAVLLVRRLVDLHLTREDRRLLEAASLIKDGPVSELEALGFGDARERLESIARHLPLVHIEKQGRQKRLTFAVHDLVGDCLMEDLAADPAGVRREVLSGALNLLASRCYWSQALVLLDRLGTDEDSLQFLYQYGSELLRGHRAEQLLELLNALPLNLVMSKPRCLYFWSQALYEIGEVEESLARAAAAVRLADYEHDHDTVGLAASQRIVCLMDQGRTNESIEWAEGIAGQSKREMSSDVRLGLLVAYATALAVAERRPEAEAALCAAEDEALRDPHRNRAVIARLARTKAFLHPFWSGDYAKGILETSPLLGESEQGYLITQVLRGNLAWMLVECGRLGRAESLLRVIFDTDHSFLDASYSPLFNMIAAARGDHQLLHLSNMDRAHESAVEHKREADIQVNRLYQSAIARAQGDLEESLDSAERAFEGLSRNDFFGFSRLAIAEVAASLLALGDAQASRDWLASGDGDRAKRNFYHALCGALVLAVADAREGDTEAAVSHLIPFADYIRSDSANWRTAMYCRCFPELLGLLVLAVGVHSLPVHMLRMLLPENAERGLRTSRSLLSEENWRALGIRCLGEDQFTSFVDRKGKPICRVRLFGGLEVSVDDRAVRERDWKKRKSRLLFAMLVVRRGQDVPRDEILEYLWPDLDEDKAKNNFYVAWSTMKSALMPADQRQESCPYIESRRGRCRIIRDSLRSDVDEFEELLADVREHEAAGRTPEMVSALQDLMSVYRGDLLPGDVYDDWFATSRDKYKFEFVDAMLRGVELLLEHDDPCEALVLARRGLAVDPYREDLYQAALRCHIAAGQRSAAIDTFIQCKTQLAEQLGLDPDSDTMALYQQILAMEDRPRLDDFGLSKP